MKAQNPPCTSTFSAMSGTIEDGSGNLNYANNLNCAYVIQPPQANSITLNFLEFRLGAGDVLKVIRGSTVNGSVIQEFRQGSNPSSLTIDANAVTLHFMTDAFAVAEGWRVSYNAIRASCPAPQNLQATSTTSTTASLEWQAVPGAIAYEAEYRLPGASWNALPITSNNSILITGLQPGTTYQSWVRAICQGGITSEWSTGTFFTTQGTAPSCTLDVTLKIENITATTATAVWDFGPNYPSKKQGGNIIPKRYELQVRSSPRISNTQGWTSIIFESNTYTLTNLQPNTTYEVRGRVICATGDTSRWSPIQQFRTLAANVCQTPSNFKVETVEEDNAVWVQVSWDPVPEIPRSQDAGNDDNENAQNGEVQAGNKYQVAIRRTGVAFDTDWTNIITTGTKLYIPQLVANQEYLFRVRTICSDRDTSSFTPPVAFVTPPFLGPKNERLCFETDKATYRMGEELVLNVTVSNIILALNSIEPVIRFDSRYLEFVSIRRGSFFPGFAPITPVVDRNQGTIRFSVSGAEPRVGSGILAYLTFRIIQMPPTNTDLRFSLVGAGAVNFNNEQYELFPCPDILARLISSCMPATLTAPGGNTACQGSAVLLTANPGIRYIWYRNGIELPNQFSQQLAATEAGEYRVSVTSGPNCQPSLSNPIVVSFTPAPSIQELRAVAASNNSASDGRIIATAVSGLPPYRYSISIGAGNLRVIESSGTATFTNLTPGNYVVTVEDAARCVVTQSIVVGVSDICPTARISFSSNFICAGSSLQLSANTGSGFRYQWFRNNAPIPNQNAPILQVNQGGSYYVVITVENSSCPPSTSEAVTITVGSPLQIESTIGNATSPNANDGSITLSISGGTPPYTLQLGNRVLTSFGPAIFTGLAPGSYTLFARDNNNCTRSFSFTIEAATSPGGGGGCVNPTLSAAIPISNTGALVSWQVAAGAVCYVLSYGPTNIPEDQWVQFLVPHPTTSITIDGLNPGNYGVRVRSNCTICSSRSGVLSNWSSPRYFSLAFSRLGGESLENSMLSIYPNPNRGKFTVMFNSEKEEEALFSLVDLSGKIVRQGSWKITQGINTLAFENIGSGIYVVKIQTSFATHVHRVVVQ
ncbi:MAG: fibronectin type III domain-containing protein [Bacteroidia bacterium]|nr:fibronectin type III domain-containing protein [Bacteroidia bacterium]